MSMNNLGQSGKEIPLPEDLQARIENGQNTVTLLESESTRLQKLISAQQAELNKINEEKVSHERSLEKLSKELDSVIRQVADQKVIASSVDGAIKTAKALLEDIEKDIESKRASVVAEKASMDERDISLTRRENDIANRSRVLLEKEMAHEAKVAKLKEAIG